MVSLILATGWSSVLAWNHSGSLRLEGNHRMNWFFNQYVYGTALPTYKLDYSFESGADGDMVFGFKITQSNVEDNFRMLVPIYLELADGRTVNLGGRVLPGTPPSSRKCPSEV